MKKQDIYRGCKKDALSEFSHQFACWANNHRGWAKAKKSEKRRAKHIEKRSLRRIIEES